MTASVTVSPEASERRTVLSGDRDLLRHHRVLGVQILPGAAFVDFSLAAVAAHPGPGRYALETVRLLRPLPIQPERQAEVRASTELRPDGSLAVRVQSRPVEEPAGWRDHAVGRAVPLAAPPEGPAGRVDLAALQARAQEEIDRAELYQVYALTGIALGPLFQTVRRSWLLTPHESLAELRFEQTDRAAQLEHVIHPALLDGAFQTSYGVLRPRMLAEYPNDGSEPQWTMVPYRVAKIQQFGPVPEHAYSYVRLLEQRETRDLMAVTVMDPAGRVCLRLELLTVRFALRDVVADPAASPAPRAAPSPSGTSEPRPSAPVVSVRLESPPEPAAGAAGPAVGWHSAAASAPDGQDAIEDVHAPLLILRGQHGLRIVADRPDAAGAGANGAHSNGTAGEALVGWTPALAPARLGDPAFARTHGVRYAYVVGEMANGIASEQLVVAAARAGLLAFFGAGGLEVERVAAAVRTVKQALRPGEPFGFSLLHDVHDLLGAQAVVDLYLRNEIRCVNASAFVTLTPPIVHYRVSGIHQRPDGEIVVPNRVFAKVSRAEVARRFMEPPPAALVDQLVRAGRLTEREADLARHIPLADDVTAEADSGGHTDRQPLVALLPALRALRDEVMAGQEYARPIRVGAAGGLGTPEAVAAAFTMGADYVLTGSINQACVEAGTSRLAREMLAEASPTDVAMGADAGSFEMGSQVQVLRRGTLFAARSQRLLELYRRYGSLAEIPPRERQQLETTVFRRPIDDIWRDTQVFFKRVDPRQLERAEHDERHRLALVLRWYLGLSSKWAQQGLEDRRVDFQVWCGPSMGTFNAWVSGSFLEDIDRRGVVVVAENLMHGAAAVIRRQWLTAQGVQLPPATARYRPRPFPALSEGHCCAGS